MKMTIIRIFFLDNVDPDQINGLLDILDLNKTLVNVITKSGDTAETMSQFMIVKDRLEKELGDEYRKNVVATTDKQYLINELSLSLPISLFLPISSYLPNEDKSKAAEILNKWEEQEREKKLRKNIIIAASAIAAGGLLLYLLCKN